MIAKFCCCELRRGIIIYAILSWISTGILLVIKSVINEDKCETEEQCRKVVLMSVGGFCLTTLIYACLLIGAYRKSRVFLLPYLILKGICLGLLTIVVFILMFSVPTLFPYLSGIVLGWYCWVCAFYYFQYLHPAHPLYSQYADGVDSPPPYSIQNKNTIKV